MRATTRPLNETCLQSISSAAAPTTMTLSSSCEYNRTLLLFSGERAEGGLLCCFRFYTRLFSARAVMIERLRHIGRKNALLIFVAA